MAPKTKTQKASNSPQSLEIDLINGSYNSAKGAEIICHLLNEKIKFLQLNNFSELVRFGEQDQEMVERTENLKSAIQEVQELLKSAKNSKELFRIESKITISKVKA